MTERVAVLSGGGSNGAYHIGALDYAINVLGYRYEAFYGTSSGALIAAHMCHYPIERQDAGIRNLRMFWGGLVTRDIYRRRTGGIVAAAYAKSIYDSQPLLNLIRHRYDERLARSSGVRAAVSAVNWDTGEYRIVDQSAHDFPYWVYASAAYPVFFAPVRIDGHLWGDGGMVNITPIKRALVDGHRTLDAVLCEPKNHSPWNGCNERAFPGFLHRLLEIQSREVANNDIELAGFGSELVELRPRYRDAQIGVLRPSQPLIGDSLLFEPTTTQLKMKRGYNDAKSAYVAKRWGL